MTWPVVLVALCIAGCTDSGQCAGVGDSCQIFCCLNLSCHATDRGGYCTKGCRCHGSSVCTPTTFNEGCPQGSACLALASDGSGECVQLCTQSPCTPGQVLCENSNDAGISCRQVEPPPDLGHRPD